MFEKTVVSCQDHGLGAILVHGTTRLHIIKGTMNHIKYVEWLGSLLRQVREWFPASDFIS